MKIIATSLPPPEMLAAAELKLANPFCREAAVASAGEDGAPPAGRLRLPRNLSRQTLRVAELLSNWGPEAALYLNPVDPREYLALYEAWQSVSTRPFEIMTLTVHARLDPESRLRPLPPSLGKLGLACGAEAWTAFREAGRAWADWESRAASESGCPPWDAYRQALVALENPGWLPGPPGDCRPAPATGQEAAAKRCRIRLAVFGDWLLDRELFQFVEALGARVVFVQKSFDPFQWDWELPPDRAWVDQTCFRSPADRIGLYAGALAARAVDGVLGVYSTFSMLKAQESWFLAGLGRPSMVLESESPGSLSAQDRVRLENFLFSPNFHLSA